jgi:hypothetical protein
MIKFSHGATVLRKVESLPNLKKKGGGADGYIPSLSLIFFAGNFLLALLTYIDRNNKRK